MASESEAVPETSSQAGTAVDSVAVLVQMLAGDQIELSMPASSSVDEVKAFVAEARKLHPKCFQFIVGTEVAAGGEKLESLVQDGKASLALQLVKLDPLLSLRDRRLAGAGRCFRAWHGAAGAKLGAVHSAHGGRRRC